MAIKKNSKKDQKWIIGLVIICLIFGYFIFKDIERYQRIKTTQNNKQVEYSGVDGKTVFELLKSSHDVEYTKSDLGVFIISIDNLKTTDGNYWIYYVNDRMGEVAADKFLTENGQKIIWKYEKLQ
jgi:hypothetical protein